MHIFIFQAETYANKVKDLENDLHIMGEIAKETKLALNFTQVNFHTASCFKFPSPPLSYIYTHCVIHYLISFYLSLNNIVNKLIKK